MYLLFLLHARFSGTVPWRRRVRAKGREGKGGRLTRCICPTTSAFSFCGPDPCSCITLEVSTEAFLSRRPTCSVSMGNTFTFTHISLGKQNTIPWNKRVRRYVEILGSWADLGAIGVTVRRIRETYQWIYFYANQLGERGSCFSAWVFYPGQVDELPMYIPLLILNVDSDKECLSVLLRTPYSVLS